MKQKTFSSSFYQDYTCVTPFASGQLLPVYSGVNRALVVVRNSPASVIIVAVLVLTVIFRPGWIRVCSELLKIYPIYNQGKSQQANLLIQALKNILQLQDFSAFLFKSVVYFSKITHSTSSLSWGLLQRLNLLQPPESPLQWALSLELRTDGEGGLASQPELLLMLMRTRLYQVICSLISLL